MLCPVSLSLVSVCERPRFQLSVSTLERGPQSFGSYEELKFIVEVKKQSSCLIQLTNNTHHNVAFKVKTTSPKKYSVRPNVGIVDPKSTFEFVVTMQAQKVAPDMACRDKFLIQSTIVPVGTTEKDITPSMFAKDNGKHVEEVKMRVALISPPESPVLSPINGVLKQGPFFEPSVLKDPVENRVEILAPPQTIAKSSEFKKTNGHELNTAKDAELKPKKDGIDDQELKPKKDGIHDKDNTPVSGSDQTHVMCFSLYTKHVALGGHTYPVKKKAKILLGTPDTDLWFWTFIIIGCTEKSDKRKKSAHGIPTPICCYDCAHQYHGGIPFASLNT
ncbi:hypothetical protein OIU78_027663 [Salix suchowensis]|nr:hypothetical protein OIU78_027663 [Salix suchowensis]